MRAYGDARLAALKAGLALTPDQEKNWPAFEQAARDLAKLRFDRLEARRQQVDARRERRRSEQGEQTQQQPATPPASTDRIDRLRQRGATMEETGAALKKLADAADPLYKSLDDAQKRRFAVLGRLGDQRGSRPGLRGGERRHHMWRDGRDRRRSELSPGQFDRGQQFGWRHHRRWRDEGFDRNRRSDSGNQEDGSENL
jgi:hypothetical protein